MLANPAGPNVVPIPVAIHDRELLKADSFSIEIFELCTMCGARFGIGYFGLSSDALPLENDLEELPHRLTEILAKDHRQHREHKNYIELDF